MDSTDLASIRHPERYLLSRNGNDLAHRSLHHHGIGQIHQVNGHRVRLLPYRDIEDTLAFDRNHRGFICDPFHRIAKKPGMIDIEHFPKRSIDIAGEIDHTRSEEHTSE